MRKTKRGKNCPESCVMVDKMKLPRNEVLVGDAKEVLDRLPENSVDMSMTSPPYWGLRDYGEESVTEWEDWKGQLGLEPTPDLFVKHLVTIFEKLKKPLKPWGTLYVVISDTYNSQGTEMSRHWDGREKKY